jgi:hypothetical protein
MSADSRDSVTGPSPIRHVSTLHAGLWQAFAALKLLYKPFGLIAGIIGGMLARAAFRRIWRTVAKEEKAPSPKDRDRAWREVVAAAAVQGAVLGGVKAFVDRAGATGFEQLTGVWPGKAQAKKKSGRA